MLDLIFGLYVVAALLALVQWVREEFDEQRKGEEQKEKRNQELEQRAAREEEDSAARKAEYEKRRNEYVATAQKKIQRIRDEKIKKAADEALRRVRRDLDEQDSHFLYEIGRHANETLALRYGIANDENAWSGKPARSILLRKLRPAGMLGPDGREIDEANVYLVELTRFRNRQALAVIVKGQEFVKTFLPIRQSWFDANKRLEEKLKGNVTFTLKEIAQFNILHSQDPP